MPDNWASDSIATASGSASVTVRPRPFTHDAYREILEAALESGYQFISFPALAEHRRRNDLVCLLRHDCDNDLVAAVEIARIEEQLNVRSTYFLMLRSALYNLLSPTNMALARE